MELNALCLVTACLLVSPDRSQFFRYQSFFLSCWDQLNSSQWTVKRRTAGGVVTPCSSPSGPTCLISKGYESDSGLYWCQSSSGQQSNSANITITDHWLLLEAPVLPSSPGASVTLRCRTRTPSDTHRFDFSRDGVTLRRSGEDRWTLRNVSAADQGLYSCAVSGGGAESAASPLTVYAPPLPPLAPPPPAVCSFLVTRLMTHLVLATPLLVSTLLLVLIHRDRNRATPPNAPTSTPVHQPSPPVLQLTS